MRATFDIGDPAENGISWEEEIEPAPVPGDTIFHDGHHYVVQPFPLYTQQQSSAQLGGTFKLIKLDDSERNP
jgi:hypothetical protein